jgi:DNA ligase (NAD+)
MAEYQNLFTSVQPVGPLHHGIDLPRGDDKRTGTPFLVHLLGRIGNAQIGPVYLGSLGVASLVFGIAAFNIIGLGDKQIEYFVEEGLISCYADIFRLEEKNLSLEIPIQERQGWGEKSVELIFNSIANAKEVVFNKFIYSLSIPLVGSEVANLIAKSFKNYRNLIETVNSIDGIAILQQIDGIGEHIALSVCDYLKNNENLKLVEDLLNYVTIKELKNEVEQSDVFAFTGTLQKYSRGEAEEMVKQSNAIFSSSITKKVDYLVVGDDPSSAKINKAKTLGIKMIDEDEFLKILRNS